MMRKIREIFLDDVAAVKGNVIAIVLLCGLIIVPSLYAWFSLLAFWDPLGNTSELKVAVANEDEGYQSELLPVRVEVGSQVINELRANEDYKWTFVSRDKAIEGVNSGEYYAAIVLPKEFSKDLLSVFALEPTRPTVEFYINGKVNPISTLLMGENAVDVLVGIDQTFSRTAADIAFGTASNLSRYMDNTGIEAYAYSLIDKLGTASTSLANDAEQVRAFSSLLGQTSTLIKASSDALERTGKVTDSINPIIHDTQKMVDEAAQATDACISMADGALAGARASLSNIRTKADDAFNAMSQDPAALKQTIAALQGDLAATRNIYAQARDSIQAVDPNSPLIKEIDNVIAQLDNLSAKLGEIASEIDQGAAKIDDLHTKLSAVFDEVDEALKAISSSLGDGLKEKIGKLGVSLNTLDTETQNASTQIKDAINTLTSSTGPIVESLQHTQSALDTSAKLLSDASSSVAKSHNELNAALQNEDLAKVRQIISGDPQELAKRFTAPVALEKHPVYGVADFASAISPLYTSLVLFVGAILSLVVFKSRLTPERREKLGNPSAVQEYFGHGAFLLLVAVAQAFVLCTGNLFYLGIQCVSIPLYYLTGITAGIVFFALVYSLVFSLSNLGRGLAVVLLVSQVASTGGELPIQLSGPIFQAICPWLPFTYSMRMFQDAVAGTYGNQFLMSLLCLLAFLIPALFFGLVLQRPFRKLINYIDTQLHEADVL